MRRQVVGNDLGPMKMTVAIVEELAPKHHRLLQALHPLAVRLPDETESLELLSVPAGPEAGVQRSPPKRRAS